MSNLRRGLSDEAQKMYRPLVERLREWADYAEKRMLAAAGNAVFLGVSDHKMVREAADRIEEQEQHERQLMSEKHALEEALREMLATSKHAHLHINPWCSTCKAEQWAERVLNSPDTASDDGRLQDE